jgi:hypothetical protein
MIAEMDAPATRALAYLRSATVRAVDPRTADEIAGALTRRPEGGGLVRPTPHGGIVCFSPTGRSRRVLELDRGGAVTAVLSWRSDGELDRARLRTAGGDWIGIETQSGEHAAWGRSDRLYRLRDAPGWQPLEPLTVFEALRWSAIRHIPPLAEPARLPSGAGTAVLNLISALATDQGAPRLRYRGPCPTEQLFTALLESFRFETEGPDPLQRFMGEGLDWLPAPHERVIGGDGLCVQLREGVEKAVLDGRAYYRARWQSVTRNETLRLHEVGDTVVGAAWALGHPLEEHFVLDRHGALLARHPVSPDRRPAAPIGPRVHAGVTAVLRARSAPALDRAIGVAMGSLRLEWGGLARDLADVGAERARLSRLVADAGSARICAASTGAERLGRALEVLVEMARLLAGPLRLRAQSLLAAAPPGEQHAALSLAADAPTAATIAAGAEALAEELEHQRRARGRSSGPAEPDPGPERIPSARGNGALQSGTTGGPAGWADGSSTASGTPAVERPRLVRR